MAFAQAATIAAQGVAPIAEQQTSVRLPALTPLRLRVVGEVSSKTHQVGQKVTIVLAQALPVSDSLAIRAGTTGIAEVIHVSKPGMGGKAGELLIAARTLDLAPSVSIPLRSFRLAPATGKSQEGLATGLSIAGGGVGSMAAMFITGGSARVLDGAQAFAKTASEAELPVELLEKLPDGSGPLVIAVPPAAAPANNVSQK